MNWLAYRLPELVAPRREFPNIGIWKSLKALFLPALAIGLEIWIRRYAGWSINTVQAYPEFCMAIFHWFRTHPSREDVKKVEVWVREKDEYREDPVYRAGALRFLFQNPIGRFLMAVIGSRRWFNRLLTSGKYSPRSKSEIEPFIREHRIDVSEFVKTVDSFGSFAEFFNRELRPETRPIDEGPSSVISPCDGVLQWAIPSVAEDTRFEVKGYSFTLIRLMDSTAEARKFIGGELLGFYLAPFDYHRYCYPFDGELISRRRIGDRYFSVNEKSIEGGFPVFDRNIRISSVFESRSFEWAMIEIAGFYVGSIEAFDAPRIAKGLMKGAFQLGGSFIVLAFEAGAFRLYEDISDHLAQNQPVRLKLGERIGEFR